MDSKKFVDYLYNKRLPKIYTSTDSEIGTPLYRFLYSLMYSGSETIVNDAKGLATFIDYKKCPDNVFPFVLESFGIKYDRNIPIEYQRRLLANVGEVVRQRGTYAGVKFLAKALTGFNIKMTCEDDNFVVSLLIEKMEQMKNLESDIDVIRQYITAHIPYYISLTVSFETKTQTIKLDDFKYGFIKQYTIYNLLRGID